MNTATDLLGVLRRHYLPDGRPPAGVFAPEIESPCGKRRADALWMPTTWSGERTLVGHEIKVTRSDVLAELADPTKADAWAKYCGRWWLVVLSPALVDGLDVPESWGIMSPPSGRRIRSMTIVREAPKLRPVETGPAFRRVATWLMHRGNEVLATTQQSLRYAEQERDRLRRQIEELRLTGIAGTDPRAERIGRILAAVDKANGGFSWVASDKELDRAVIDAVVDHVKVRDAAQRARWELAELVRGAQAAAAPMKESARLLAVLDLPQVMQR